MKPNKAADFLANMNAELAREEETPPPKVSTPSPEEKPVVSKTTKPKNKITPASRKGLKHIGGYCDDDTAEKFAIMRVRLKLDNSELLIEAINELYDKYKTKKVFSE